MEWLKQTDPERSLFVDLELLDVQQQTEAWHQARLGIPTASSFKRICDSKGYAAANANRYLAELLAEFITGQAEEVKATPDMQRGTELEPVARAEYELQTGHRVYSVGGVYLDGRHNALASPDGLMPQHRKGLEIKCPKLKKHIEYCMERTLPSEYAMQVYGGLLATGYESWDFVSYCPEYKTEPLLIIPVQRDETVLRRMREVINGFCLQLDAAKNREKRAQFLAEPF